MNKVHEMLAAEAERSDRTEGNKQVRALLRENKRLRQVINAAHAVRTQRVKVEAPKRLLAPGKRRATAVAMASDWHVDELVSARKVVGLNRYNPAIADFRAQRFFAAIEHMVTTYERTIWTIRDLVLILNGDLFSGWIHEELMANTAMSPIQATLFVEAIVSRGLKFLAERLPQVKIRVVCQIGNHGRATHKVMTSMAVEMSYEYIAYVHLAQLHPECTWDLPTGRHSIAEVYGLRMHVHHFDTVKSQGGVGGILVPLNRAAARWREKYRAHMSVGGHFHQYMHTPQVVVNGSLIGYSSYADSLAQASPEPPQQAFWLIDEKRGVCQTTALWVGDLSAEKDIVWSRKE